MIIMIATNKKSGAHPSDTIIKIGLNTEKNHGGDLLSLKFLSNRTV